MGSRWRLLFYALAPLVAIVGGDSATWAVAPNLTLFAWSDQHVKADGDARHLEPVLTAMRKLPGQPFPARLGGEVSTPDLVLGCGDCTDWPTRSAVAAYARTVGQLPAPAYDIMGNHDEGDASSSMPLLDNHDLLAAAISGAAVVILTFLLLARCALLRPRRVVRLIVAILVGVAVGSAVIFATASGNDAMARWIISRHGGLSYSFDRGGVHVVMVFSRYTSPERISDDALQFIRRDLAGVERGRPVIVASHYCFESIHNRDALIDAFGDANVVLVLGGHFHQATTNEYRGVQFVQIPSARYAQQFSVVRVSDSRICVAVWDARRGGWASHGSLLAAIKKFY